MIEKIVRRLKSRRGQTLIEFAFVLPLILVFFFSLVDFGIAIDRRITLQHAVREGARFAAVHTDQMDIKLTVLDQAQGIIDLADIDTDVQVCYKDPDADMTFGEPGEPVQVSAFYTWEFPIMKEMLGAFGVPPLSIDLTPSATSRLERSVSGAGAFPC